jgi:hypothetical protein
MTMPLHYERITITNSDNSQGNTHNDPYRCRYKIKDQSGQSYIVFGKKGATLRNLPLGTVLKIGWKLKANQFDYQEKIIEWFEVLSTPKVTDYRCRMGTLPTQDIDQEYAKILQIMGK